MALYGRGTTLVDSQLARAAQKRHEDRIRKVKSVVETSSSQEAKWHRFKRAQKKHRRRKRQGNAANQSMCGFVPVCAIMFVAVRVWA